MSFGAVYCVYDDIEYLELSLESIKNKLDKIVFLVSDVPWNGQTSDTSVLIDKIESLSKVYKNIELRQGHWISEAEQRNFGLDVLFKSGIDYCFIIDSDEIYRHSDIDKIKQFVINQPQISAFHIEWNTYWKKDYHVISPRESFCPLIVAKVNSFKFIKMRQGITSISRSDRFIFQTKQEKYNGIVIPSKIAYCFHFSYARCDEFIRRKLETSSHHSEFLPKWFEDVWLKWKSGDTNLHPVTPSQYKTTIKSNFLEFPSHVQTFIKKERKRKCSIILLNWNSLELTKRCLEMISKTTQIDYEIILVDNGSKENIDELKKLGFKIILNQENRGFAEGVNQSIKIAKSKNDIVLLNVDAEPQENWLESLYETLENNAKCGIVGPLGNNIESGYQKERMVNKDTRVFNVHFYCVLIFREVIEKIGLFDTRFGLGGYEDNDFCIRSNLAGYQCWVSSKSLVKHDAHQVFKKNNVDFYKLNETNKQILQNKLIDAFYEFNNVINYFDKEEIAKKIGLIIK